MIFTVSQGCFSYPGHKGSPTREILKDISYTVKKGEILGILGANGVGKTTLLRCSMGMLPWKQGESRIDGKSLREMTPAQQWQRMAYVPQAKGTSQHLSVREMVLLGRGAHLKPWQQPGKKDMDIAQTAMEQVGITWMAEKYCHQLSGGELQMVLIARALAGQPEMLVLDEPESNLDFKNQLIVLETLRNLASHQGISCIFNTHYPSHALEYSSHALLLDKSGGCLWGPVQEVITQENLRRAFGVNVYLHEVEIEGRTYREILPLSILPK